MKDGKTDLLLYGLTIEEAHAVTALLIKMRKAAKPGLPVQTKDVNGDDPPPDDGPGGPGPG